VLLNHERQTPRDWDDAVPSLCPDCGAVLIARRGRILVWHWAHRARPGPPPGTDGCACEESSWHLLWKDVYHRFDGWEVEVPVELAGERFRLDAARLETGRVREFVHSLSERYLQKHLALKRSGLDVLWIFDGERFVAERRRGIRRGGFKHLLKPKARWLHARVGGLVHWDGALWREWKADCWYPVEGDTTAKLLASFSENLSRARGQLQQA
jgi:hypothetical protein